MVFLRSITTPTESSWCWVISNWILRSDTVVCVLSKPIIIDRWVGQHYLSTGPNGQNLTIGMALLVQVELRQKITSTTWWVVLFWFTLSGPWQIPADNNTTNKWVVVLYILLPPSDVPRTMLPTQSQHSACKFIIHCSPGWTKQCIDFVCLETFNYYGQTERSATISTWTYTGKTEVIHEWRLLVSNWVLKQKRKCYIPTTN